MTPAPSANPPRGWIHALGPGLLLAAVSVGVSHLVQSTRAGAMHGLGMAIFIVVAMAMKYPSYRFAPRYTFATQVSILEGFRRQGFWALGIAAVLVITTTFASAAAITLTTAGVAKAAFNLDADVIMISAVIMGVTAPLLMFGGYRWLDWFIKPLMLVLAVSTVLAAALAIPLIDWSHSGHLWPQRFDVSAVLFTAALVGFMPAPMEAALAHSLWSQAKVNTSHYQPTPREASIDFHLGYFGTLLLAICFMLLGAGVMHGSGITFAAGAGPFANQVIALYEQTLGAWSRPLISISALAVMYSTVVAFSDAAGRLVSVLVLRFRYAETPNNTDEVRARRLVYRLAIPITYLGGMAILGFFMSSFKTLIDATTTLAFLATPVLALLIHRAMMSADVPESARPGPMMRHYSQLCLFVLTAFALGYIYLRVMR